MLPSPNRNWGMEWPEQPQAGTRRVLATGTAHGSCPRLAQPLAVPFHTTVPSFWNTPSPWSLTRVGSLLPGCHTSAPVAAPKNRALPKRRGVSLVPGSKGFSAAPAAPLALISLLPSTAGGTHRQGGCGATAKSLAGFAVCISLLLKSP